MKLEASELRIGNYLVHPIFGDECQVNGIVRSGIYITNNTESLPIHIDAFEPIPLTIEELLKFEVKELERPKRGVLKEFVANGVRLEVSNSGNIYYKNSKRVLGFVHHLQNLYHSLRGEELKRNV